MGGGRERGIEGGREKKEKSERPDIGHQRGRERKEKRGLAAAV